MSARERGEAMGIGRVRYPSRVPTSRTSKKRASKGSNGSAGGLTYADSGVDLENYAEFTGSLESMLRKTHGQRVIPNPGGFAGLFRLDYNERLFQRNYREPVLVACTDGCGTKVKIAAAMKKYDTIGIDLVGMSVNDLVVQGAEPLFFLDYVAVAKADNRMLGAIVGGVSSGCQEAGCALLGGETAEMPDVYRKGEFDLAGFAVGVVELKRAVDPERVEPGDVVLGLESDGVHANGYSLVRKIVSVKKLDLKKVYPDLDADRSLGEVLLTPTRIYAQPIVRLLRHYRVKRVVSAMSHITGGGLAENLERSIGEDTDAVIDLGTWTPNPVFTFLQKKGQVSKAEMYRVFNMGIGYVLVVRPSFAKAIAERLEKDGERVHVIGHIEKGKGRVRTRN